MFYKLIESSLCVGKVRGKPRPLFYPQNFAILRGPIHFGRNIKSCWRNGRSRGLKIYNSRALRRVPHPDIRVG